MSTAGRISEVQGLRGIAVLAVVCFHARIHGLPGGFLGVDVFFVISGFVISLMLRRDMEAGRFRFREFYVRRAWRLMPALAVTLVASGLLFGFLLPVAMDGILWQSLAAAAFGVSNFFFNGRLDYFDGGLVNPALHTWSLGVEEQFYLVFPLLLFLLYRHPWWRALKVPPPRVFVVLTVAGFAAAVWQTAVRSEVAFYLPWFRAWEFFAGVSVAFSVQHDGAKPVPTVWLKLASWLGLLLLAASLFIYRESYPFPGVGALAPVLGTVLLIVGVRGGGVVSRFLAWRPLTLTGDLSYSLYLAHWPITCAIGLFCPLDKLPFALLALSASAIAGYLLWRCVETPLRRGLQGRFMNMPVLAIPVVMACVALLGFASVSFGDSFWRRNPDAVAYFMNSAPKEDVFRKERCFLTLKSTFSNYAPGECLPAQLDRPALLVLGDSLAANVVMELKRRLPGVDVQQATSVDYKPGIPGPRWPAVTAELDQFVQGTLFQEQKPKPYVLLYARWDREDLQPLKALVKSLIRRGYDVTVIGPSPQFYVALPFLAGYGDILNVNLVPLMTKADRLDLDKTFAAELTDARYVSIVNILCGATGQEPMPENCTTKVGADLLFFDKLHYTPVGARYVFERLPLLDWFGTRRMAASREY